MRHNMLQFELSWEMTIRTTTLISAFNVSLQYQNIVQRAGIENKEIINLGILS